MSDNKKYYYLKLVDNFYERDEMIILESMPDGYMYSNILLKLYLRSLKNEGKLMHNDRIPYNSTMLANATRFPVAVIEKAISIFRDLGLIEILDNGAIYMLDIQNYIGKSSTEADRKRAYRNRIETEKIVIGQMSGQIEGQMSDKTPPEIRDKSIEIRDKNSIYTEENRVSEYANENLSSMSKLYQQNIGMINGIAGEWLIEVSEKIDTNLFKKALEICTDRGITNLSYLKGIIKKWLQNNITTYEQLKAYELQNKKITNNSIPQNQENIQNNDKYLNEEDDPEFQRLLEEENKKLAELNKKTWGDFNE